MQLQPIIGVESNRIESKNCESSMCEFTGVSWGVLEWDLGSFSNWKGLGLRACLGTQHKGDLSERRDNKSGGSFFPFWKLALPIRFSAAYPNSMNLDVASDLNA